MSRFFVEVPGDSAVSGRTVEADYAEVEFGILRFFNRATSGVLAAFHQWNNFTPIENS